jgi:GDPmannose 4,6-dehydratase
MWRALQQPEADDYVVGTGQSNTVREFLELAFSYANLDWNKYVEIDQRYVRPLEVNHLQADNRKAVSKLGWSPKIRIAELAKIMVDSDMELIGLDPIGEGNEIAKSVAQN